jgi:glycerate kinase
MKFLLAPNAFHGSLSATHVAQAFAHAIQRNGERVVRLINAK